MKDFNLLQIGGFLMLLVLLVLLVINTVRSRKIRPLLYFFIIPVLLLGWSSIKTFKVNGDGLTLDKTLEEFKANPIQANKLKVEEKLREVKSVKIENPVVLEKIAEAEHIIGKNEEAKVTLELAGNIKPLSRAGLSLLQNIRLTQKIDEKLRAVEAKPTQVNTDSLKIYRDKALMVHDKSFLLKERILKTDGILNATRK